MAVDLAVVNALVLAGVHYGSGPSLLSYPARVLAICAGVLILLGLGKEGRPTVRSLVGAGWWRNDCANVPGRRPTVAGLDQGALCGDRLFLRHCLYLWRLCRPVWGSSVSRPCLGMQG